MWTSDTVQGLRKNSKELVSNYFIYKPPQQAAWILLDFFIIYLLLFWCGLPLKKRDNDGDSDNGGK